MKSLYALGAVVISLQGGACVGKLDVGRVGNADDSGTAGSDDSVSGAPQGSSGGALGNSSGSSPGGGSSSGSSSGGSGPGSGVDADTEGPCEGGQYAGALGGSYTSHLTGAGIPVSMTGNVNMTLDQEGSDDQACMLFGEVTRCSDLYDLRDGTITGVANGNGAGGGFPYLCTMTGTLGCAEKKLVNGWIQCTYCAGPPADGGACASSGVGGQFAGTLTANYDTTTHTFVMGTWNGAEALAGNDGGSPGPDGGPPSSYLSDSGTYLAPGDFGGSGTWSATWQ
jgi:hypothetical protein